MKPKDRETRESSGFLVVLYPVLEGPAKKETTPNDFPQLSAVRLEVSRVLGLGFFFFEGPFPPCYSQNTL